MLKSPPSEWLNSPITNILKKMHGLAKLIGSIMLTVLNMNKECTGYLTLRMFLKYHLP